MNYTEPTNPTPESYSTVHDHFDSDEVERPSAEAELIASINAELLKIAETERQRQLEQT